ncbi:MAG: 2-oxoacid:acceptor oxidoreductase family protein [Candidatus Thermoplasmatota archaeon]
MLKEIIFYGRGGQGAVTAANLLASAALKSGNKGVQAFPFFGAERRGAPVKAFARISDREIFLRSEIKEPDIVVVLDMGIVDAIDVTAGLKEDGIILLNSNRNPSDFSFPFKVATVDATSIAIENKILVGGIPVVNTPIVGALVKLIDGVKIEALYEAIKERFPEKITQNNINASKIAYERVKI